MFGNLSVFGLNQKTLAQEKKNLNEVKVEKNKSYIVVFKFENDFEKKDIDKLKKNLSKYDLKLNVIRIQRDKSGLINDISIKVYKGDSVVNYSNSNDKGAIKGFYIKYNKDNDSFGVHSNHDIGKLIPPPPPLPPSNNSDNNVAPPPPPVIDELGDVYVTKLDNKLLDVYVSKDNKKVSVISKKGYKIIIRGSNISIEDESVSLDGVRNVITSKPYGVFVKNENQYVYGEKVLDLDKIGEGEYDVHLVNDYKIAENKVFVIDGENIIISNKNVKSSEIFELKNNSIHISKNSENYNVVKGEAFEILYDGGYVVLDKENYDVDLKNSSKELKKAHKNLKKAMKSLEIEREKLEKEKKKFKKALKKERKKR